MATIKILPKNIFEITDFYNLGLNKIKGTSGSIITTSTTTNNIGNDSWNSFGGEYTTYSSYGDWYKAYRVVPGGVWEWQAIRYIGQSQFFHKDINIDHNDFINYKNLRCDVEMTVTVPEDSGLDTNSNISMISSTNWGTWKRTSPPTITPTGFGGIVFEYYNTADGKHYVYPKKGYYANSNDVNKLWQLGRNYISSFENISYAIDEETKTDTTFTAKLSFPQNVGAAFQLAAESTNEFEEPGDDPTKWTFQNYESVLYSVSEDISLSNLSTTFTSNNIEEINKNTNYGTPSYYKFDENSFFRTDMVKGDKSLFFATSDDIINKWSNGRKSAKLKCSIGEYNDTSGALALSTKDNTLPMFFKIGDIVEPYIVDGQGKTVPLSKKPNGNATQFEVLSVKLYTDGACWQDIELLETT